MKLKKLLALSLAAALSIGMAVSVSAAELDTTWYAANNPDVVAIVGATKKALQRHYNLFGRKEGRMANNHDIEAKLRGLFDAKEYAALYPDIKAAFGEDEEAMFKHYITYGLLESRRPCEKVSYEAAAALKEAVATAMENAGVEAVPGSEEVAAFIEGEIETVAAETSATVETLTQATAEVEKAVEVTVTAAETPAPTVSASATAPSVPAKEETPATPSNNQTSPDNNKEPETPANPGTTTPVTPVDPVVEYVKNPDEEQEQQYAIVADMKDISGNDASGDINGKLGLAETYNALCRSSIENTLKDKKVDGEVTYTYTLVTFGSSSISIPEYRNMKGIDGYWIGVGLPYKLEGNWGLASSEADAVSQLEEIENASEQKGHDGTFMENENPSYYTFYWDLDDTNKWGYLMVYDTDTTYKYVIDFTNLTKGATRESALNKQ